MAEGPSEAFDEDLFETRLEALKDTQDGIQQMSAWCLQQRPHHKKIVACWLNVFKTVRVEHRLTLFHLANDVIQYSKRRRLEFVESWATALQRATTMVRDDRVKSKILRIFKIWEEREIYSEEYLSDLCGLLNINPPKKTPAIDTSDDFQNAGLIMQIRECVALSEATDRSFKKMPRTNFSDIGDLKQQLKDKTHTEDMEKEIERSKTYMDAFMKNLHLEIKKRKEVLTSLDTAVKFYKGQREEVKVVVNAYKNFGSRIKVVNKKLEEMSPNLPSPIPSPDINAPSPEPDTDLQLPDEQTPISTIFKNNINGYSSYLDGNLPFDINDFKRDDAASKTSQPIEVIGSRSEDEGFNTSICFYKPESISAYPSDTNVTIPGLNPISPVQSEYTSLARATQQYSMLQQPSTSQFNNNNLHHNKISSYPPILSNYHSSTIESHSYSKSSNVPSTAIQPLMPPPPMPPSALNTDFDTSWNMSMWNALDNSNISTSSPYRENSIDTPVSPPRFECEPHNVNVPTIEYSERSNTSMGAQDVDHRQLHLTPFNIGAKLGLSKDKTRQLDIDHRNLISLTGSPGPSSNEKKSWMDSQNQKLLVNNVGDVDYRTQVSEAIDTGPAKIDKSDNVSGTEEKCPSPQKSSIGSTAELGDLNEISCEQMVVDMDMSDEDLDDIFKEVNASQNTHESSQLNESQDETLPFDSSMISDTSQPDGEMSRARPPLLQTPTEHASHMTQNVWESPPQMNMHYNEMQSPQNWNQMPSSWSNKHTGDNVPPPPRPPFPPQFVYPGAGGEYNGRVLRGRGWPPTVHNQFRNSRPPRGPYHGSPYYPRGGRGNMRGGFRGKGRGNDYRS